MEWNRGSGQTPAADQPVAHAGSAHNKVKKSMLNMRTLSVGLLFCVTIIIVAMISYIAFGSTGSQSKFVDKSKMQAVFLNGGQVYFGKISDLSDKSMRVSDIYYLRVNQTVQPNGETAQNQDISLVKLGCELHGPQDSMVVNQDQVIFWENLKDDGQVAKAVAQYKKDNPNGQNCAANTNNSSTNSGTNTTTGTGTTNNSSTTNSTTNSTTKKP